MYVDQMMTKGYGRRVLGSLRSLDDLSRGEYPGLSSYPRVLGRDLSGEVLAVGRGVTRVRPGDEVWGALHPSAEGSHQELCLASEESVSLKPGCVTHLEAASVPYAGLTAWAGLQTAGVRRGQRVMVVGGAGGVGSLATQILARYYNCHTTVLASSRHHQWLSELGASTIIDNRENVEGVENIEKMDVILDCAGIGLERMRDHLSVDSVLNRGGRLVSFSSPVLNNTDRLGLLPGAVTSIESLARSNKDICKHTQGWGFFQLDCKALELLARLLEKKIIVPTVSKVFKFSQLPQAYTEASERGKTVIDMENIAHVESKYVDIDK